MRPCERVLLAEALPTVAAVAIFGMMRVRINNKKIPIFIGMTNKCVILAKAGIFFVFLRKIPFFNGMTIDEKIPAFAGMTEKNFLGILKILTLDKNYFLKHNNNITTKKTLMRFRPYLGLFYFWPVSDIYYPNIRSAHLFS